MVADRLTEIAMSPTLYIGGEHVEPRSGETFQTIDPSSGKAYLDVPLALEDDVDAAVMAAQRAFDAGWGRSSAAARGAALLRLADLIDQNAAELAQIESRDNGKSLRESQGEMAGCSMWYRHYAGVAQQISGRQIQTQVDTLVYTVREPLGVVAGILPWNSPLMTVAWKLGPSLATGNTIVIKPAEQTPVTTLLFAYLLDQLDLPPGVVNFVSGDGRTGRALVRHPNVRKIAFTGSTETGRAILRDAADRVKHVSLELGGKSPHIIFADADLEQASSIACSGVFSAAGQTCVAGSRVLVQRAIYDDFLERYAKKAKAIRVGRPLSPQTQMGAQISEEQLGKIEGYVQGATSAGATVVAGGERLSPADSPDGFFYSPTIVSGVTNDARIAQEEIFGPVAAVIPFADEEEAVQIANATEYGLSAGLWTRDVKRAHRVASRLQAGSVWVNTYRRLHCSVPFGGYKQSGLGRESGDEVLDLYTQVKAVWVDLSEKFVDPYTHDGPVGPAVR